MISTTPTPIMIWCGVPGRWLAKPAHRYLVHGVIQLKNLSTPNTIGATTNAVRRMR